jgi:hypothetical protein
MNYGMITGRNERAKSYHGKINANRLKGYIEKECMWCYDKNNCAIGSLG